jgi:hypothetical protein
MFVPAFRPRQAAGIIIRAEAREAVLCSTKRLRAVTLIKNIKDHSHNVKGCGDGGGCTSSAGSAGCTALPVRCLDDRTGSPEWTRYIASTNLGAKGRVWEVSVLAIETPTPKPGAPIVLCLHGHGSSCCAASWSQFFPAFTTAG